MIKDAKTAVTRILPLVWSENTNTPLLAAPYSDYGQVRLGKAAVRKGIGLNSEMLRKAQFHIHIKTKPPWECWRIL